MLPQSAICKTPVPGRIILVACFGALALLVNVPAQAALNDTGQNHCLNTAGAALEACNAANTGDTAPYPRQDGRFGRDAAQTAGQLPAKTGGGDAGFDFTRLCNSGEAEGEGSCPSGMTDVNIGTGPNHWGCTRDNVTGLLWKTATDASTTAWTAAMDPSYQSLVDANNGTGLCGVTGWRLPTRRELLSIVHHGRANPAIDDSYFPDTQNAYYWSSDVEVDYPFRAWGIVFDSGQSYTTDLSYNNHVRLVRGGQSLAASFVDLGDGTVLDQATGLIWDQCALGQSGDDCGGGSAIYETWQNALGAVVNANNGTYKGYADWRLPTRTELESLVDITQRAPAIDGTAFPNTPLGFFWSSTASVSDPSEVWDVNSYSGSLPLPISGSNNNDYVRLVRGGQYFGSFDLLSLPGDPATYTAPSPTGTGEVTAVFNESDVDANPGPNVCNYRLARYITVGQIAGQPGAPSGVSFPHGLFEFETGLCAPPGGVHTFTITYPAALPVGAQYWKYGPTAGDPTPHWYTLPGSQVQISADRKTWTISITDGGLGDDDLTGNGMIIDQGGPGVPVAGGVSAPVLPASLLVVLAGLLGVAGWRRLEGRVSETG